MEIQSKGVFFLSPYVNEGRGGLCSLHWHESKRQQQSMQRLQEMRQGTMAPSFAAPPWDQSCWDNGGNRGTNHHFELLQAFSDHHLTVARWCLHIRVAKAEDEVNEPMEANYNCRRWTSWSCSSFSSSLFTIVKLRTQRRGQTHALLVTYQSIQREAIRG